MTRTTRIPRRLITALLALLIMIAAPTPVRAASSDPVTIPDSNFAHCITNALGLPEGTIPTETQLTNINNLYCAYAGVTDLSGADKLTNLTQLNLYSNQISDLTPLAGLTKLDWLHLGGNQASDLTPLAGLSNLTHLDLYHNHVSALSSLAGLTNLTYLHLGGNQVRDLTLLAGLTNLTFLDLWDNQVSDLTPLAGLTNLTQLNLTLHLSNSRISNLTPLAGLTNLTHLYLSNNEVSDLTPLAGLTNLTYLELRGNQVSDLTPLAGLTNLTNLYLYVNQISDLTPLAGLTNLTGLFLDNNQISDLTPLSGLANLTYLFLDYNQVSDLTPLSGLANLTSLSLQGQAIVLAAVEVGTPFPFVVKDWQGNSVPLTTPAGARYTGGAITYSSPGDFTMRFGDGSFSGTISQTATPAPALTVSGTVTAAGTPVADVKIALFNAATGEGIGSTTTNGRGGYTIANVAATSVKVKASKDGYQTVYQDGKTSLTAAAAVSLNPSGTTTINITLPALKTVTGTVTSGATPVSGAKIALFNATTGAGIGATTTNSSGGYTLPNVTATRVKVKASKDGYQTVYQDGKTSITAAAAVPLNPADVTTINITLPALRSITGTVTSGGSPMAGAKIALFNAATGAGVGSTTTNSSGGYTLPNVTATSVKVKVTKDGYRTVYQDGKRSLATAAAVPLNPAGVTTVDISVPSLQTVTGTVTSGGTSIAGAKIALFNAVTGAGIGSTTTNSSGVYTMANLTATSIKIKITKDGYKTIYHDGTTSLSAAAPVTLSPADSTKLDITLTPTP